MPDAELPAASAADGVAQTLAAIVAVANTSANTQRIMSGWDRTIALVIDGVSYAIIMRDGQGSLVQGPWDTATLSFTLTEGTLNLLVARQITPLMGKLKGLIHSSGSIVDILRFSSLLSASVQQMSTGL